MNTNKNSYTIVYASVIVIVVAFLLAFVNSALKDRQDANVRVDTQKQILAALNVRGVKDVQAAFAKYVKSDELMQADGTLQPYKDKIATNYEAEVKTNHHLHVFVCDVDGQTKYVIPVYGSGLWGAIWGYLALNADRNTLYGAYFSHASETPGLGAEIANEPFQDEFKGKQAVENGEVALSVVKHGKVTKPAIQVDGLSGATLTSNGVNNMVHACLHNYLKFLTANQGGK
jgi:Na+-transporting NADH:ubiquinone oxidoreductase subunit C